MTYRARGRASPVQVSKSRASPPRGRVSAHLTGASRARGLQCESARSCYIQYSEIVCGKRTYHSQAQRHESAQTFL